MPTISPTYPDGHWFIPNYPSIFHPKYTTIGLYPILEHSSHYYWVYSPDILAICPLWLSNNWCQKLCWLVISAGVALLSLSLYIYMYIYIYIHIYIYTHIYIYILGMTKKSVLGILFIRIECTTFLFRGWSSWSCGFQVACRAAVRSGHWTPLFGRSKRTVKPTVFSLWQLEFCPLNQARPLTNQASNRFWGHSPAFFLWKKKHPYILIVAMENQH